MPNQVLDSFKIKEVFIANRLWLATQFLKRIELFIFKSLKMNIGLIETYGESCLSNIFEENYNQLKELPDLSIKDWKEITKCINKVNSILHKNGYDLVPLIELNDDTIQYPIDISEVNKERSFGEHRKNSTEPT